MAAGTRRVSIGFHGGQVLALRVSDGALDALTASLGDGGWQEIASEDGPVRVDLGFPFKKPQGQAGWQVYFSIGQFF